MDAYQADLAYIHDVGYGDFARAAAPGVLDLLRRHGVPNGLVVDLGCGSGIWAKELCAAGYRVLGIDLSRAMVAIARRRVPKAEFRVGSFLDATLPPCDAVTSLGECLNYLFDPNNGLAALRRLFRRVHASLRSGGLFVFDVAEPGRGNAPLTSHRTGSDWACLTDRSEDQRSRRITRRITAFRRVGKLYHRHEETHHLQLYVGSDLARSLREAGFRARIVRRYGRYPLPKGMVGLVARKP